MERLTGHLRHLLQRLADQPSADTAALSEALDPLVAELLDIRVEGRPPATYFEGPNREWLFN